MVNVKKRKYRVASVTASFTYKVGRGRDARTFNSLAPATRYYEKLKDSAKLLIARKRTA